MQILPYLEQTALWNQWNSNLLASNAAMNVDGQQLR